VQPLVLALAATTSVAEVLVKTGGLMLIFGMMVGVPVQPTDPRGVGARIPAARILSRILWDQNWGAPAFLFLRKFLPEAMCVAVKEDPDNIVLIFEADHETPEIIWHDETRSELRSTIVELITQYQQQGFGTPHQLEDSFFVQYKSLAAELCVGGVYVRLFLKEPGFNLRDPRKFLEALMARFLVECEKQLPSSSGVQSAAGAWAGAKNAVGAGEAIVVAGDDLLTMTTNAIVCLLKVRNLAEHIATWGYPPKMVTLLQQCHSQGAIGLPLTCCVRLIHVTASSTQCVDAYSQAPVLQALMSTLQPTLHKDSAFILQSCQKLFENKPTPSMLVPHALSLNMIPFLMHVLEEADLSNVVDASGTKVHAIQILKIMTQDANHGQQAEVVLESMPGWERYKHQKHDLFVTQNEKIDYFLADSTNSGFKMLTNTANTGPT
jgi:DnaJ family protein C protein 13